MKLDGMLFNKYEDRDVSVYARTETIDEFVEEFDIEFEYVSQNEYYDMLEDEEYLILSRYFDYDGNDCWTVDPLKGRFGQTYNECEVALIEKGLHKVIDFEKIDCDKFDTFDGVVTYVEDEDIELDLDVEDKYERDWLDDVAEDILDALVNMKKDRCPHCIIKEELRIFKEVVEEDFVERICDLIED